MTQDEVQNLYFDWLCRLTRLKRHVRQKITYWKLLTFLHQTPFIFSIPLDSNRAEDGIGLRYRFSCDLMSRSRYESVYIYLKDEPCSVLEMMIALAIRCETIMDNPEIGDRTNHWFWTMIGNIGLLEMHDEVFDRDEAKRKIDMLLERRYKPNGEGGLFVVNNCRYDMRGAEIWYQMSWYLDSII